MSRTIKRLIILFLTATGMLLVAPGGGEAHADLMQCPYPATGFQAVVAVIIGSATGYICDYPLERNMAHLHAEFGGFMTGGGQLSLGSESFHTGAGLTMWSQSWRCPDERYIAAPPNGIGAWNQPQDWKGVKCPAVQRAPLALDAPWPPVDPNIVFVVNQILPPGQPDPTAAPPQDPPAPPEASAGPGGTTNLNPSPPNPIPLQPQGS